MYAQLGTIIFDNLKSPSEFEQRSAVVYAEHSLIDGKPRLQRTGSDLERIKISMDLHYSFCDVQGEIDALHDAMNAGDVLPLITGYGMYVGDFVIVNMSRELKHATPNGFLIAASVEVSLSEFVEGDKLTNLAQSAVQGGFAMLRNTPGTVLAFTPIQGIAAAVSADVEAMSLESAAITRELGEAATPSSRARLLSSVADRTRTITAKVGEVTATIAGGGAEFQAKTQGLRGTFRSLQRAAANVRAAASIQDYSGALQANQALINANNATISAGASIAAITATRR
jgi:phage protein U